MTERYAHVGREQLHDAVARLEASSRIGQPNAIAAGHDGEKPKALHAVK